MKRPELSLHHVRTEEEGGRLQTRKWVLTRHRVCSQCDLGLPASRTVKYTCLFLSHTVYAILLCQPEVMKTGRKCHSVCGAATKTHEETGVGCI